MRTLRIAVLLYVYALTIHAEAPKRTVPAGSKVYVESPDGFDIYMTKAIEKKQIPLTVVAGEKKRKVVISGLSAQSTRTTVSLNRRTTSEGGVEHAQLCDQRGVE